MKIRIFTVLEGSDRTTCCTLGARPVPELGERESRVVHRELDAEGKRCRHHRYRYRTGRV